MNDTGYRNEWMAIVVNLSNKEVTLKKGERICQIILSKLYNYKFVETDNLLDQNVDKGDLGVQGKIEYKFI
ncbi:MAG: hypothetical protein ACFFCE_09100 [Promethearchaeota archaeon]